MGSVYYSYSFIMVCNRMNVYADIINVYSCVYNVSRCSLAVFVGRLV